MADVTTTVHVRVTTYDPAQRTLVPVPGAQVLVEDSGWLWDPNLSTGADTTDADGRVAIALTYDGDDAQKLNPLFTVTIPEGQRAQPASSPADRQLTLPDDWETHHGETHSARDLLTYTDAASPFEIIVGLPAQLRIAYTDFDRSGIRNPLAVPEHTARLYLADYDTFLWIDFLNPDDTLTGFGFDPRANRTVPAGEHDDYPYFDTWPTAPSALAADPGPTPRAWVDPPGMPVGTLGGRSFTNVGPLAVDGHGFVFMVEGPSVQRFYPDGTHAETIVMPTDGTLPTAPASLAVDQYRTLFVSDAANHRVLIFQPTYLEGQSGLYFYAGAFGTAGNADGQFALPSGLAVVPNRVVDAPELLAVVDSGNQRVQVFTIDVVAPPVAAGAIPVATRSLMFYTVALTFLTKFGSGGTGAGQFQLAVAIAADRQKRLFVCDSTQHRVSRWSPNAAATTWSHDVDWEHAGGGSGSGDGEFDTPLGIAVDSTRNTVYVADSVNVRVQRLDADSGAHQANWTAADVPLLGGPMGPVSVAVDARGEIYVADPDTTRVVRGTPYNADGSFRAATEVPLPVGTPWTPATEPEHMKRPTYVAYGPGRTLWVSDTDNDRLLVYTLATLTAPAAPDVITAGFSHPVGVAVDPTGAAWVVDGGNSRILPLDAARATGTAIGSAGAGANQFNDPRGIALVARETVLRLVGGAPAGGGSLVSTETPLLLVADRGNNRVQVVQGDGTFLAPITTDGTTALVNPEDVTVNATGQAFVADTGNGRIVRYALAADGSTTFQKAFAVPLRAPGVSTARPTGVSMHPGGSLLVTDNAQGLVFQFSVDGDLQAYWDLHALLRLRRGATASAAEVFYEPELAQMLLLSFPTRAVLDEAGVMAIADSGHDRVRLLRAFSDIRVTLFDLGEGLPDISVRAVMQRDMPELGLELNVGDVSIFDDSQEFSTEPIDDFAGERFETTQLIGPSHSSNAAINVMRVVRMAQTWYGALTHQDDADHRWAVPDNARTLNVDLIGGDGSYQFLDVNLGVGDPHGRGSDAWDDSTLVHEMSHWVFYKAVEPFPPFSIVGLIELASSHGHQTFRTPNVALSEGWAEYAEMSWGGEYGATDRVRGYTLTPTSESLTRVRPYETQAWRFLPGGSAVPPATVPTFDAPEAALPSEGYFANALYQVHRALVDPGVMFADSPAYWYRFNVHVTDAASTRYSSTIWRALRSFETDPPMSDIDQGTRVYLRNLLTLARTEQPALAQTVRSILELNNLLMPRISITEGTSTTAPGTALDETVHVAPGSTRELIVQVTDATGAPCGGYNVRLRVGDAARYTLVGGPPPIHHGRRRPGGAATTTDLYRATNVNGIVRVTFTAPALPAGTTSLNDVLRVEYQPDFDTDETFSPPEAGDDLETTLRRLYLYELRYAAKTWVGTENNFGAIVSHTLTFEVSP